MHRNRTFPIIMFKNTDASVCKIKKLFSHPFPFLSYRKSQFGDWDHEAYRTFQGLKLTKFHKNNFLPSSLLLDFYLNTCKPLEKSHALQTAKFGNISSANYFFTPYDPYPGMRYPNKKKPIWLLIRIRNPFSNYYIKHLHIIL